MRTARSSVTCDRVRAQVSLQLDGELSVLEQRMMEAHIVRCAECRTYAQDVVAATTLLREAPLEPVPYPIVVHRPRRVSLVRMQAGAAAAIAVAMLGAAIQFASPVQQRSSSESFGTPARYDTSADLAFEIRQIAQGNTYDRDGEGTTLPI